MASHDHDALWAKLWELELRLAAYKLLHAARWGLEEEDDAREHAGTTGSCCRGRQYDAYVRRRDARRACASAAKAEVQQPRQSARTRGRPAPLTIKCAGRDTPQVRPRSLPAAPVATTPRKEPLARSRTVSGSGAPAAARPQSQSHQRRNSVGGDLGGDCATPRPFLRRGSGTGGATRYLQSPRVHDLPSPRRPPPPQDQLATKPAAAAGRHLRSVSEVPLHAAAAAAMESPRWVETPTPALTPVRARKQWGSVESPPPALFSAAATNPHMDLAKGLRKLLSFVRKSKSSEHQHGGGGGGRESGGGKPVKGWAEAAAACYGLDGPLDRARLDGHRFPMTRAVGTSG
uniref:Uncharacterized protein n=1 Tax=Avena sativa TaxID=4498 RepID=A0ACD5Y976_AVESA